MRRQAPRRESTPATVKPVVDGDDDSFQVAQAVSLRIYLKSLEETGTSGGLLWCEERYNCGAGNSNDLYGPALAAGQ